MLPTVSIRTGGATRTGTRCNSFIHSIGMSCSKNRCVPSTTSCKNAILFVVSAWFRYRSALLQNTSRGIGPYSSSCRSSCRLTINSWRSISYRSSLLQNAWINGGTTTWTIWSDPTTCVWRSAYLNQALRIAFLQEVVLGTHRFFEHETTKCRTYKHARFVSNVIQIGLNLRLG